MDAATQADWLLEVLYQCPMAIMQVGPDGETKMMNAQAANLLLPLNLGAPIDNLFEFLRPSSDAFERACLGHQGANGIIAHNLRIDIECKDRRVAPRTYSFEVSKLDNEQFLTGFKDVSSIVQLEQEAIESEANHALQNGRLEVVTGVLHDIGNAITAIGTRVATMIGEHDWPECENLEQLSNLFRSEKPTLESALGAERSTALVNFASALHDSVVARHKRIQADVQSLHQAVTHVQEILAIQRSIVRDGHGRRGLQFRLEDALQDALTMVESSYTKRRIRIDREIPADLPECTGDRTRLTQLLLNVLKNGAEAHDARATAGDPHMKIEITRKGGFIHTTFSDGGAGFDEATSQRLFESGWTTKSQGSGTGLRNCRAIAESHGGSFEIRSDGPDRGAVVTLVLPLLDPSQA